jgi:hypothetical protein
MTAWVSIPNGDIDPDSPITTSLITALRDNPIAITEKASGAPVLANDYIATAMIANSQVTQAKVAAAAVGQSQLKTSISSVSTTTSMSILTLPGGTYGFYPQIKADPITGDLVTATIGGYRNTITKASWTATYATRIVLGKDGVGGTLSAQQRYVAACPPYDHGDGRIGQFIFVLMDNATGCPDAVYAAPEAPWHLNGPTDIRADFYDAKDRGWRWKDVRETDWVWSGEVQDYTPRTSVVGRELIEITQAMKMADMLLIPHPFIGNDLTGKTIVLLDPVSDYTWNLAEMHEQGVSPNELIHGDFIRIDNTPINRAGPPGVLVVPYHWKFT